MKHDVERILGELIRDGEVESDKREKTTLYRLTFDTCIKNTEKYAQVSIVNSSIDTETTDSAPGVIEGFGEYQNPGSAVSEPEESKNAVSEFADVVRESISQRGEAKGATWDDILGYFDGDRVPASAFLVEYGFEVQTIDGQQMVVEVAA